jgi:hypothetical protein
MADDGAELRAETDDAFQRARRYHGELREIYEYFLPFRAPTVQQSATGGSQSDGDQRTDLLFDATGVASATAFAGTMQADWMPLNQPFFSLEAGPVVPEGDGKKLLNEAYQQVTDIAHGVLSSGKTHSTVHEMCFDLFAGTGAMYIAAGDDRELIRGRAVPITEIALDEGPYGDVWHIWWRRKWKARDIPVMWPQAKISTRLGKIIKEKPRDLLTITQYTSYNDNERRWTLKVFAEGDETDAVLWTEHFRVNPWITPRFYKVPGEVFGRGLAHIGLPFVKTANKARELALTAAAFAVMGIFTRRNDGSFNPDTATFAPLSFWQVGSNGGPLGPTLQRLPIPQDFDVSSIIIQDERAQIKSVLMDDDLPDQNDPVRSATEIAGRLRRHSRRYGGVNARLSLEAIVPLVQRVVDILESKNRLPVIVNGAVQKTAITIDQFLTQVRITSPAMASQHADRVEKNVNYLQMISMLLGPQAVQVAARIEDLVPELARWSGVEERHIRSKLEIKEMMQQMQQAAQQQQAAASAPRPAAPPPADPAAQYASQGAL